jgi:hypothetical protein
VSGKQKNVSAKKLKGRWLNDLTEEEYGEGYTSDGWVVMIKND